MITTKRGDSMTALYPGIAFSPQAELTDNIGAADTVIPVSNTDAFPPAPNLATIGVDEEGETVLYTAKTGTALSGCQRGVEGAARARQAGAMPPSTGPVRSLLVPMSLAPPSTRVTAFWMFSKP